MNIFEKFSLSREVIMKEGEIKMDDQRMTLLPINFVGIYSLTLKNDPHKARNFYNCMKKGMANFSIPLGKEFHLTYKGFMERWAKYAAFGGWGVVEYELIDNEKNYGFLKVKGLPLHVYLKNKGLRSASDVIFEGLIAGSLSSTFKADLDVIETECICSGKDACVYYWGSKEYLTKKFPDIASQKFGDK